MNGKKNLINGLQRRIAFISNRVIQNDLCRTGVMGCELYMESFIDQWNMVEPLLENKTSEIYKRLIDFENELIAFYRKTFSMRSKGAMKQQEILKDPEWRKIQRDAANLLKKDLSHLLN